MTGRVIDEASLDRLLAFDQPPPLSTGFAERVAAEAQRPGRPRLPAAASRRGGMRRWTRRGILTSVVAINLVLASAVAAAIGGGAISVEKITAVAHRIVAHFHHAHHAVAPAHRLAPRAVRLTPRAMPAFAAPAHHIVPPMIARPAMRPRLAPPLRPHGPRARMWRRAIARSHPMAHLSRPGRRAPLLGARLPRREQQGARPGFGQAMPNAGWRDDRGIAPWRDGREGRGWRAPFRGDGGGMRSGGRRFGPGWRRGGGGFRRRRF